MLEARDITFGYPGAKPLYSGFSLQVEPGERVALQAPSGFGKTTLCRVLAGFERPQAGEVLLDGRPLPRRGVCPVQLIQQHPEQAVDPRLRMRKTLAEAGDVPQELLDNLGIRDERMLRYPHELSGGELQRFCIARALATDARAYLFDDSFSALDYKTDAALRHELSSRLGGKTVVIVAQRISTVLNADQIVVLDDGRVVGAGTHEQLMESCQEYREIAMSQLSEDELKGGDAR